MTQPDSSALTDEEVAWLRSCRTLDVIPTAELDAAMPDLLAVVSRIKTRAAQRDPQPSEARDA